MNPGNDGGGGAVTAVGGTANDPSPIAGYTILTTRFNRTEDLKLLAIWTAVRRVSSSRLFALTRIDFDTATKPFRNELTKEARSPASLQARIATLSRRDARLAELVRFKEEQDKAVEMIVVDL